ncbi:MAG: F0F1 ATP synthase subunit delta, partial [Mesorhizobium sp.]
YAGSLFELALQANSVGQVEADLNSFAAMLEGSSDLTRLINSPVFSSEDQAKAIAEIADKAGITGLTGNFLRVVAQNRRLFAIPGMIKAFRQIAAEHRGETAAEVTSAHALTDAQQTDPSLLGGLVVKIGSRQIDTSLKTKLNSLKLALKEVG